MKDTGLTRSKSITEYFIELVEEANKRRHFNADDMTTFYIVNLLKEYTRAENLYLTEKTNEETLVTALENAMGADEMEKESRYKRLGDYTLFVSGFFHDSLSRSLVDVNYYICIGQIAYKNLASTLSATRRKSIKELFEYLSNKFKKIVDVLSEVSNNVMICNNLDILRVYDRWLKTGSARDKEILKENGIIPINHENALKLN